MNIGKFIKENEPLNEMPYIVVFEILVALQEMGVLKDVNNEDEGDTDGVDQI